MAQTIQALLAKAESAAALGNEHERDAFVEKATSLQLKYAISDAMAARSGARVKQDIKWRDFCTESNTPLIKAKRILINSIATHHRGKAVMMPEMKGGKLDRRAKVRVW